MRPSRQRCSPADSPFAPVLGNYRRRLARPLADQFLGADRCHRVRLVGSMHQIWRRHGWLRPLFSLLAWAEILFPETGRDVPVSLTIEADGHGADVWRRTFTFARERRFNATMAYQGSTVIERLGPRGMLEVPWHLCVQSDDAIQITTGETRLRIGPLRLRFPRWLRFTVGALQRARAQGRMDLELVVTHPRLGRVFGYSGTFTVRRELLVVPRPNRARTISLERYGPWFYAAALYNVSWGAIAAIWPAFFFVLIGVVPPNDLPIWQALGMMVMVYGLGYWWLARDPVRHRHLILIALLGKGFGPLGFVWAVAHHLLPLRFGLVIATNDLLWLPAFAGFAIEAARASGSWRRLAAGR
jgi:small multidrug resistance pump